MSALSEVVSLVDALGSGYTGTYQGFLPDEPDSARSVVPPPTGAPTKRSFGGVEYEVRRYQVFVREADYPTAETKAEAIWGMFDAVANTLVGSGWYLTIDALQPPGVIERDAKGRPVFSFNIEVWRKPV